MKKVLVTGASGFIGTYVVDELLKYKVEVIASSSNTRKGGREEMVSARDLYSI
jgi:dTDP-6-deoxy-L-talose 4-dehydrogenase (NAD+)